MIWPIVHSSDPITLVGGGPVGPDDLKQAVSLTAMVIAADSGASVALAQGHVPHAVIGDMDSIAPRDLARIPPDRLFPIQEQDSTDFDKALRNIDAPLILAVGFLGARVDHQLAAFNALVRHADRPCILIGQDQLVFHIPAQIRLELNRDDVVSLFPMQPVTGRSTGLAWPIDGLDFAPARRVGTSNRALGTVQLWMDGPGMLAIVPRAGLARLMPSIASACAPC
jgi:thiamine pyrophosphokinase